MLLVFVGRSKMLPIPKKMELVILKKKTISIVDTTEKRINLDIFGENFEKINFLEVGSVAAFHDLKLKIYNNENFLLFTSNSSCMLNESEEIATQLKDKADTTNLVVYESFSLKEAIEMFDKTSFVFNGHFEIVDVDLSQIYKSCPIENCQKKIKLTSDGKYECVKCKFILTMVYTYY